MAMKYKALDPERIREPDVKKCKTCPYFTEKCVHINRERKSTHMEQHPICWCCKHMTDGTCEFATCGIQVPNSVVNVRISKKANGKKTYCYNVRKCPKFERG